MYPTAPGTSRDVLEDIVIDGIHIPGGVTCFVSHLFLNVFVPLKQEVCVRTQKGFIVCFCFLYVKDNGTCHLKTHNETRHSFDIKHKKKKPAIKMFNKLL